MFEFWSILKFISVSVLSLDGAVPVDLEVDPLVHELLQLRGVRLAAHDGVAFGLRSGFGSWKNVSRVLLFEEFPAVLLFALFA